MDLIAAKLGANMAISELAANGQIGGQSSKTYTFDGNLEGKEYVPYVDGAGFVKVSSDTPDLYKFEKIDTINGTLKAEDNNHFILEGTAENNELFGAKGNALMQSGGSAPFAVVITDTLNSPIPSTGLYFLCMDFGTGIEAMTHELVIGGSSSGGNAGGGGGNQGGGELPVIDLRALGMEEQFRFDQKEEIVKEGIPDDARDELVSKISSSSAVVIKFVIDGMEFQGTFNTFCNEENEMYTATSVMCFAGLTKVISITLDAPYNNLYIDGVPLVS